MNYKETLDYLYTRLPMFTRIGAAAIKKDLTNTIAFCKALDNPQDNLVCIHIAGTNGKGSTSHMLAAILQTAGYKTGLYTSPHLVDFRERIRINGEMIPQEAVTAFVEWTRAIIEEIDPSFFEVTVAMAFDHFRKENVDIAVIETGLGGRLDSMNIITPILSIITNISYDHTNILGSTLQAIAFEKAGIIKQNIPVIISERQDEVAEIFVDKARETQSELIFASDSNLTNITVDSDLKGSFQLKNIQAVLAAVQILGTKGFTITESNVTAALRNVKGLTGLAGRWQTIGTNPLIIADTGHNEAGIREVLKNIQSISVNQVHMVIGMVKDKDVSGILELLPTKAIYYFCEPPIERAKPVMELWKEATEFGLEGSAFNSVTSAVASARQHALPEDLIFIGGSTFVVAEVLKHGNEFIRH